MTRDKFDIIDKKPGYVKIKIKTTRESRWVKIKDSSKKDPPGTEYGILTPEVRKALGALPGMEPKSWKDMTEEERRLFTDYENNRE